MDGGENETDKSEQKNARKWSRRSLRGTERERFGSSRKDRTLVGYAKRHTTHNTPRQKLCQPSGWVGVLRGKSVYVRARACVYVC